MERMTIPDMMIDEKTTCRTIIDASEVRKCAMEFYWRLKSIEDILGDDYDLDRLRELVEADRDGRCVVVTRCCECRNHSDVDGDHYCKFWRMYCPDDSEFYCKDALKGDRYATKV